MNNKKSVFASLALIFFTLSIASCTLPGLSGESWALSFPLQRFTSCSKR
jgi:hypothetical protein